MPTKLPGQVTSEISRGAGQRLISSDMQLGSRHLRAPSACTRQANDDAQSELSFERLTRMLIECGCVCVCVCACGNKVWTSLAPNDGPMEAASPRTAVCES